MHENEVVSFDDELLIVVDQENNILDYRSKRDCHRGEGVLHRAFSIFIFNANEQLILQQRSDQKLLWPQYWSNSCCSHPRKGELTDSAAYRRLHEELGIKTGLKYLYTFQYQATYGSAGSENELCAVYIGKSDTAPRVNKNEISDWQYIEPGKLSLELIDFPEKYTPWFKMEWEKISNEYMDAIKIL